MKNINRGLTRKVSIESGGEETLKDNHHKQLS